MEAVPWSAETSMEAPGQGPGTKAARDDIRSNPAAAASLFSHMAAETGSPVQMQRQDRLPKGEEGFAQMWAAHPHNYLPDESQNTSSEELLEEEGLPGWIGNTCAVRLSVMLNQMGLTITPDKTRAAGIRRAPMYSRKTKQYYILGANEMWTYLAKNFRRADQVFPATGLYKDASSFQEAFDKEIRPIVSARKGIVAFETIFGYSGTGHVDIFDGETLSDAPGWYPCKKLHLWYVVVP
ncbi:MAG: T6SS effector amidase Tae4 family protein [Myxococcales bacterium]|nr:type VI secretion system amidase effector protein Tae4 [Myxococcota bacterium]MDW8282090.1 T6SS effector amidase Tae4 family protein [Myxococcales bacterium]